MFINTQSTLPYLSNVPGDALLQPNKQYMWAEMPLSFELLESRADREPMVPPRLCDLSLVTFGQTNQLHGCLKEVNLVLSFASALFKLIFASLLPGSKYGSKYFDS